MYIKYGQIIYKYCKFCSMYIHVVQYEHVQYTYVGIQPAYINFILYLSIFLYVRCFYTCFLFKQLSAGQHGTAYKYQVAVPEGMLASINSVYEGNS